MVGEYRDVTWRQGDIFVLPDGDRTIGIVISHDCDICADPEIEPCIEWIPISIDEKVKGELTLGKNPRVLQTRLDGSSGLLIAKMQAPDKRIIGKPDFVEEATRWHGQLLPAELTVFRRWLSARYSRSAFPNAFEDSMRKIQGRIDKLASKKGAGIRGLYFDLDDNTMQERRSVDGPYELGIYVVYPPETPETDAIDFCKQLKDIFDDTFFDGLAWQEIHLLSCDQFSEDVFPLSLALNTKTWRVDHRSLGGIPASQCAPEPDR